MVTFQSRRHLQGVYDGVGMEEVLCKYYFISFLEIFLKVRYYYHIYNLHRKQNIRKLNVFNFRERFKMEHLLGREEMAQWVKSLVMKA